MIDICFTVTESEYLEAQKLFVRHQYRNVIRLRWILVAVYIASSLAVPFIGSRPHHPSPLHVLLSLFMSVCVVVAILGAKNLLQRLAFGRRFRKEKRFLTDVHARIDDQGYWCEIPGVGSGMMEWLAFDRWTEGYTVIFLVTGSSMTMVSKSSLTPPQLSELRMMLQTRVSAQTPRA